jgi:hypothetical protein
MHDEKSPENKKDIASDNPFYKALCERMGQRSEYKVTL